MEAYILKYKFRRFLARLWYWVRQIMIVALLAGVAILAWRWESVTAERITSKSGDRIHVIDGDSFTISSGQSVRTIRIQGIDAPEYRQTCRDTKGIEWACGKEARTALEAIIKAGGLECLVAANDSYHRTLGTCSVSGTDDIGREMVARGMAVSGAERSDSSWNSGGPYLAQEAGAEKSKRGIWRGSFQRPADWRAAVAAITAASVKAANE